MRGKTLLKGLMALAITTGTASAAGSTSVDVPVAIDYSGGCIMNLPSTWDLGTLSGVQITDDKVYALNPLNFTIKCVSGTNYTISMQYSYNASGGIDLVAGIKKIQVYFYKDSGYSQLINSSDNYTVKTGTGDGNDQVITIYPTLGRGTPGSTVSYMYKYDSNASSDPIGTYTGNVSIQITW